MIGSTVYITMTKNQAVYSDGHPYCSDDELHSLYGFNGSDACVDGDGNLHICEANFPDKNFRTWLANPGSISHADPTHITLDEVNGTAGTDGITSIDVSNKSIADLSGIEYFTSLKTIFCSYNELTDNLDLSKNTALEYLYCNDNSLKSLNLSENTALKHLYCHENSLTSLGLRENKVLETLNCSDNCLQALDLSKNIALETLYCSDNCLQALNLSYNPALVTLNCRKNCLPALDLSENGVLEYINCGSQTITSSYTSGKNLVNMENIVGEGKAGKVLSVGAGWSYDPLDGTARTTTSETQYTLKYEYNTGKLKNYVEVKMDVTAILLYKITFYPDNGSLDFSTDIDCGELITEPSQPPTLTDFKFIGWYTYDDEREKLSDKEFDFANTIPVGDLELYANWIHWLEFPAVDAIVAARMDGEGENLFTLKLGESDWILHLDLLDENGDNYNSLYPSLLTANNNQLNGAKIFDIYFTKPGENGTYTRVEEEIDFDQEIEIYIKTPDGWDFDNMKAFYVTTDNATEYRVVEEKINEIPYTHITTNHFSNYAITNAYLPASSTGPSSGDSTFTSVCILSALLTAAAVILVVSKKKNKD